MLKKILDCVDNNGQTWVYRSSELSKVEGKDTFIFSTYYDQSVEYFKAVSDFVNKNTPLAVKYVFYHLLFSFILITYFRLNVNIDYTPLTEKFISDLETHLIQHIPFKKTFFILV